MPAQRPLQQCTRWFDTLATHFPQLNRAEARALALWSFAATLTQHIGSTTCAVFLAELFDLPFGGLRQRLREFYWPAQKKRGTHRRGLSVEACFVPLLSWVLSLLRARELVLALDVTLIRDRLAVLSLSVVFRGSALPVAWKILPANEKGAWIAPLARLIALVAQAVPPSLSTIVLCDRGLQSRLLFETICAQGWHPMMRLTNQGYFRPNDQEHWYRLKDLLPGPGRYYLGQGHLFKTDPMACTLIALWEEGYSEPWLLMSDLAVAHIYGTFYGLRAWIEQGFRTIKSGAYHSERLRVVDPERAERIWLVLAVSMLWTHAIEGSSEPESRQGLSPLLVGGIRRVLGVHRSGWLKLLVCALRCEDLPMPTRLVVARRPVSPRGVIVVLKPPL